MMAQEYPDVAFETQILIGKPFQCILQWIEEVDPSMLIAARHGNHRIDGKDLGSQADNLVRLAQTNVLLVGTQDVRPDEIPWIEEDGQKFFFSSRRRHTRCSRDWSSDVCSSD